jgi:SAM-dependent methyltransferase
MRSADAALASCCADAYAGAAARYLLGDSFHPGGARLTRAVMGALDLPPGATLLDLASGPGTSALLAAREGDLRVVGVDLSADSVGAARERAERAGLADRARFEVASAGCLPLADRSIDGALCECALCTFPDPARAARELARVLRPGARLALSDMVADPARLPSSLLGLAGRIACIAGARPLEQTVALLEGAGFMTERIARHDEALEALLEVVDARLRLARLATVPGLPRDLAAEGLALVGAARRCLAEGSIGYASVIALRT